MFNDLNVLLCALKLSIQIKYFQIRKKFSRVLVIVDFLKASTIDEQKILNTKF